MKNLWPKYRRQKKPPRCDGAGWRTVEQEMNHRPWPSHWGCEPSLWMSTTARSDGPSNKWWTNASHRRVEAVNQFLDKYDREVWWTVDLATGHHTPPSLHGNRSQFCLNPTERSNGPLTQRWTVAPHCHVKCSAILSYFNRGNFFHLPPTYIYPVISNLSSFIHYYFTKTKLGFFSLRLIPRTKFKIFFKN